MTRVIESQSGSVSFIDPRHDEHLRQVLLHAYDHFNVYREHFERCGVSRHDIAGTGLHTAFAQLNPIGKDTYAKLQSESFRAQRNSKFVIDPSSGTTGVPVLKFTSERDDDAEAAAVSKAFEMLGIGAGNRCACLDIGASQIYLFYMRVLRQLGVKEPIFIKVTREYARACELLRAYDPDVIISIPSVLKRCLEALKCAYRDGAGNARRILYIGEPMEDALRSELQTTLGSECFSFYGTTEVGSVCMECAAHTGMHIPLELFVPTISPWRPAESNSVAGPSRYRGTVAWTSLRIREQPVIKYLVNDFVDIDLGPCVCGSKLPRLIFNNRIDETFFLYGITFTYDFFLELVTGAAGRPIQLEIKVVHHLNATNGPSDSVILTLDDSLRALENQIQEAVGSVHPLSELIWSNFLRVELEFVHTDNIDRRKGRRLVAVEA